MSGASRKRGGRGPGDQTSDTSSRRGGPLSQTLAPPGAFDGPASRGSASAPGSAGRHPSNAPSVTSQPQSPGGSPRPAQGGFTSTSASRGGSRPASIVGTPSGPQPGIQQQMRGDPARDFRPRYTDSLRNVDLPASFYNIDHLVSAFLA